MKTITYEEFEAVDLRSGKIIRVEDFPKARKPAYKIWVDFGDEIGIKQTSAQVTINYTKEDLIGKQIIGCVNLSTKNIAGFESQFLLLGFADSNNDISLITPDITVPNGRTLF
jgi:tRNA-binding protein